MNDEDLLAQLQAGQVMLVSAYPEHYMFDIPVFFEPLDAHRIELACVEHGRVAIVLDGEQPQGHEWILRVRKMCQMQERNTVHFGQSPYYYAFRTWNAMKHPVQYLVYVQGGPDAISRNRVALAMLRQWQAEWVPEHVLARIKPEYFSADRAPLLRFADEICLSP